MLLKFGYTNKTNNPNDSPSKRMFGLFSSGRAKPLRSEFRHRVRWQEFMPHSLDYRERQLAAGRSDRIRTCGIEVPNFARYQLRHTPKKVDGKAVLSRTACHLVHCSTSGGGRQVAAADFPHQKRKITHSRGCFCRRRFCCVNHGE